MDVHLFAPAGAGAKPGVILYMDAFGIRPALSSMAERLASHGYVVALPNLYYRQGSYEPFDATRVFQEGPERDRFKGMIASLTGELVMNDTRAVIEALDARPDTHAGAPLGAVGYCMGGGFALRAAGTFPDRVAAAASFHGGSLATDRPESPHRLAANMRAQLYIGVAEVDPSFDAEQQHRLVQTLEAAGVTHTLETYAGTRHGFAVTNHPVYDRDASERHWQTLVMFLDRTLKPKR